MRGAATRELIVEESLALQRLPGQQRHQPIKLNLHFLVKVIDALLGYTIARNEVLGQQTAKMIGIASPFTRLVATLQRLQQSFRLIAREMVDVRDQPATEIAGLARNDAGELLAEIVGRPLDDRNYLVETRHFCTQPFELLVGLLRRVERRFKIA